MSNKKKYNCRVVIRVDANAKIGLGHFVRCVALADMIKDTFEVVFAVQTPLEFIKETCLLNNYGMIEMPYVPDFKSDALNFMGHSRQNDIVVLDGYHFDTIYQLTVLKSRCRMVCIDDLHAYHFAADVVINYNPVVEKSDYSLEPGTRLFTGLEYLLLRHEFFKAAGESRLITKTDTCFICMGGADPKNITRKALDACLRSGKFKKINVVTGKAYMGIDELLGSYSGYKDHVYFYSGLDASGMVKLLKESQFAVCPASTISFEVFCVGLNMITGYSAENQKDTASFIRNNNLALVLGNLNEVLPADIENAIQIAIDEKFFIRQKAMMHRVKPEKIKGIFEMLYQEISVENLI